MNDKEFSHVISQWLEAIHQFDTNYQNLRLLVNTYQGASQGANVYPNYSLLNDLNQLLHIMLIELEKLQDEMLLPDEGKFLLVQTQYRLLLAHTHRLNELNKLAQLALTLANFPSN